jgi:hypothetical protein
VVWVGFTRNGRVRFQAVYDDAHGRQRSAGTYATAKEADKAWLKAEVRITEGMPGDPHRGRQTFRRYVEEGSGSRTTGSSSVPGRATSQ